MSCAAAGPSAPAKAKKGKRKGAPKIDFTSLSTARASAPLGWTYATWKSEGVRQEALAQQHPYGETVRRLLDNSFLAVTIARSLDKEAFGAVHNASRVKLYLATRYSAAPACIDDLAEALLLARRAVALFGGVRRDLSIEADG